VAAAFNDPRSHIVIDDAKSYFARGKERYDIVVSEPSNPWVSGVASLFTEEFYARLAGYLNEGGVLTQWLHTYEMDSETMASILAAVAKTFPSYVIYASLQGDVILVARKSGPPGDFDGSVLKWPALQPMLERLKLTQPEVVARRRIASAAALGPLFGRIRIRANSDYFPIVDQRASKTRFTRAAVGEFDGIVLSVAPMRDMLDGNPKPSAQRYEVIAATPGEMAVAEAWTAHDAVMGIDYPQRRGQPIAAMKELSARLVEQWTTGCSADLTFERVLPSMVSVAAQTAPYLHPDVAAEIWQRVRESRCGRALAAENRTWLDLFEASSRRDSARMIEAGMTILEGTRDAHNPATEYAFFSTLTALACRGEATRARKLAGESAKWVRPGEGETELNYLEAFAYSPFQPAPCLASAKAP
jgi:hypothetical protein